MIGMKYESSIQSVGPLKALYTSPPGIPVPSDTNSASPGSILATQQLRAKTSHSHFHHRLQPDIHLYRWVNWGIMERTKMPKLWHGVKGDSFETVAKGIRTRVLSTASLAFYRAPQR